MTNAKNMMVIRPRDCHVCGNGFYALQHIVDYARVKGFSVTDMAISQAEKNPIYLQIDRTDPLGVYGFGHGNVGRYTGNSESDIWNTSGNGMVDETTTTNSDGIILAGVAIAGIAATAGIYLFMSGKKSLTRKVTSSEQPGSG